MNRIARLVAMIRSSPTYGRDRANLFTAGAIGLTALVLNGVILICVLPVMLDPSDSDIRMITSNMEFGQLLALILAGGATVLATLLIPLRLTNVFLGPRIGRYFDQIVLSGIAPLRFVIGKAFSQNLYLALVLFLLLPWLVLVLAIGGIQWTVFLPNLFLVWLYCMMLALVMLSVSMYVNELLAMVIVGIGMAFLCGLGAAPIPWQVISVTPFPAIMQPVHLAIASIDPQYSRSYFSVFLTCAAGMATISGFALVFLHLGPLYGIIRDNSTFGEVVRAGDTRRRRWFRYRPHIQRPSELAFFYENRDGWLTRFEGLLRWSTAVLAILLPAVLVWTLMLVSVSISMIRQAKQPDAFRWNDWAWEFHAMSLFLHGAVIVLAIIFFSHARNTTFLKLPFLFGRRTTVAKLDTLGFCLFLVLSTSFALGMPYWMDQNVLAPLGATLFPAKMYGTEGLPMDYRRVSLELTLGYAVAGTALYLMQRRLCLAMWLRSGALLTTFGSYFIFVGLVPVIIGLVAHELPSFRADPSVRFFGVQVALVSPIFFTARLLGELRDSDFDQTTTLVFHFVHVLIMAFFLVQMPGASRRVRADYLADPAGDAS
jgi:hypothetical protein